LFYYGILNFTLNICSRQSGHKFGEHISKFMPIILERCKVEDEELREYCLQAFESFVTRCPKEITPHISQVSTSFYDPGAICYGLFISANCILIFPLSPIL